jgi:SAM-dependent methyltransferase
MKPSPIPGFHGTFDRTLFERLAAAEPGHFWFEERNRLLLWSLRRYFPRAASFCEVGCGSGGVLAAIEAALPKLELTGVEYYPEALPLAARRLKRARLQLGDIGTLPFRDEFDVVGCFDVLEHIPDDRLALTNLARSVKPGGGLILTVPQGPYLWSAFDELAHHQRRYRSRDLCDKIRATGLICQRISSFMTFLLPAMWLSRLRRRPPAELLEGQLHPTAVANRIGTAVLGWERRLIAAGMSFPCGASLLVIATKPPR